MKKRISILLTVVVACLTFAIPAFAANGKPSVELNHVVTRSNSADGWTATLYFRNNTDKTIKYYDWYFTLYNTVDDPTPDEITHSSTVHLQVVGPSAPETSMPTDEYSIQGDTKIFGHPFASSYKSTGWYILRNNGLSDVFIDSCGNYLIFDKMDYLRTVHGTGVAKTCIFLTPDEVKNRVFNKSVTFKNAWYSTVFSYVRLQKVVVTYMDGTTETIDGSIAEANRLNDALHNGYYQDDLKYYRPVYDYYNYKALNPDLANLYGNNDYKYLQHFITSGMAEGRQANYYFNLAAYKNNNPDLVAVFGDDNAKYYEHYITTGKAEGRKAT